MHQSISLQKKSDVILLLHVRHHSIQYLLLWIYT